MLSVRTSTVVGICTNKGDCLYACYLYTRHLYTPGEAFGASVVIQVHFYFVPVI